VKTDLKNLVEELSRDTAHLSSISQMREHPAYRKIVEMGMPVVPAIISMLRDGPVVLFSILAEITGANPIPLEDRGRISEMVKAWSEWQMPG